MAGGEQRGTAVSYSNSFARDSYSPAGSFGTALATADRKIPIEFLLADLLPFRWWYLFVMFIVAIPPITGWTMAPALVLPAAVIVSGDLRDPIPERAHPDRPAEVGPDQ